MLQYENTYNTFNNPIPRSGIWSTISLEEIQAHIASLPAREQATASMVFMFTLNSCNKFNLIRQYLLRQYLIFISINTKF